MSDPYSLEYSEEAKDDLKSIEKVFAQRIRKKMDWLAANAEIYAHEELAANWIGHFKIRIHTYRVIYQLDHEKRLIYVVKVGHRRDVYDE